MRNSPVPAKKPYHHGDLRNALLEAGLEILDREGIAAVSLRAIAARAGVSHAAPAHHFGNLKGLLTALAAIAFERLYASIDAAMAAAAMRPVVDQVRAAGNGYVSFAQANVGLFRLMFSSSLLDRDDPEFRRACVRAYEQLLDVAARAAAERGDGNSAEAVSAIALQIWSTVHGFSHLLLEGQIAPSPSGEAPVTQAPDIAGLLLGNIKPRKGVAGSRRS